MISRRLLNTLLILMNFYFVKIKTTFTKIEYTIYEELPVNTYIGTLEADADISSLSTKRDSSKEYIFYEVSNIVLESINLDKKFGKLTIKKPIDREAICPDIEKNQLCKLELTVLVPKDNWINVEIVIQDINDNAPMFLNKIKQINISENVPIGHQVALDIPKDNDAQDSYLENFNLSAKFMTHFSLSILPKRLSLVVISKLDYEKEDRRFFNGTLEACDNGTPRLCGKQTLIINVLDYNDNKPRCAESHYKVRIGEDTEPGTIILTVVAIDEDQTEFGNLSYAFSMNRNLKFINKYFSIDKYKGDISLLKQLDIKMSTKIDMIVEVRDGFGYGAHMTLCSVTIHIIDKNNHRPSITIDPIYLLKNNKLTISENEPIGTTICMLIVTDNDLDENGEVTCKLTTSNEDRVTLNFATNLKNTRIYSLKSKQIFDRESMDGFAIQVRCTDNGLPSLTSEINLDILLTDDNEFPPKFTSTNLTVSIQENSLRDLFVLQVNATDQDADSNLQYQLSRSVRDLFYINSTSGIILTKKSFDREIKDKYQFEVFVIDIGFKQQYTGVSLINVIIEDQNDNAPSLSSPKSFKLKENGKPYDIVGKLVAVDPDSKENGTVNFQLLTVTSHYQKITNNTFFIDFTKGIIYTQTSLDRETFSEYKLHVLLKDYGTPALSRIETVTVEILDVNDNSPKWLYPNKFERIINVTQAQLLLRTEIITLQISDEDSDSNCTFFFDVPSKHFNINPVTGQISSNIQYLPSKRFPLVVKACDNGVPKFCSESLALEINIIETMVTSKSFRIESISKHQLNIILIIITAVVSCFLCIALIGVSLCIRKRTNFSDNSMNNFNHISDSAFKSDQKATVGDNNSDFLTENRLYFPVAGPDVCELCITEPLLQQASPVVYSTVFSNNYASEAPDSFTNNTCSEVILSQDMDTSRHSTNHKFMSLRSDKESYIMWLKNEELRKQDQKSVKFAKEKQECNSDSSLNDFEIRQTKL